MSGEPVRALVERKGHGKGGNLPELPFRCLIPLMRRYASPSTYSGNMVSLARQSNRRKRAYSRPDFLLAGQFHFLAAPAVRPNLDVAWRQLETAPAPFGPGGRVSPCLPRQDVDPPFRGWMAPAPKMAAESVTFRKHDRPDWVGAVHRASRRARGAANQGTNPVPLVSGMTMSGRTTVGSNALFGGFNAEDGEQRAASGARPAIGAPAP